MKYYYVISNTINEYNSRYTRICESYEEAVKEIKDCANWWCSPGSGTIEKVNSHFQVCESWSFNKNKVVNHYIR